MHHPWLIFHLVARGRVCRAGRRAITARALNMRVWLALAMGPLLFFQAAGAEIAPHEARYDISLESLKAEGFPLEAKGDMAMRLPRDCQKWETLQEMRFNVEADGGEPIDIHMLVSTLEGLNGKRVEITGWKTEGGGNRTNLKGTALVKRDGNRGRASFQQPEEMQWNLPSTTKHQLAATRALIEALTGRRTAPKSVAFEVLGISEVTQVAPGKPVDLNKIVTSDPALVCGRSWLVDRAIYFEAIAQNEPFMLETLQIHENGVVSRFWQDYQTMVLFGDLVAIKDIPTPDR